MNKEWQRDWELLIEKWEEMWKGNETKRERETDSKERKGLRQRELKMKWDKYWKIQKNEKGQKMSAWDLSLFNSLLIYKQYFNVDFGDILARLSYCNWYPRSVLHTGMQKKTQLFLNEHRAC